MPGRSLVGWYYTRVIAVLAIAGFIFGLIEGPGVLEVIFESKKNIIEAVHSDKLAAASMIFFNNIVASLVGMVPVLGLAVVPINFAILGSLASLNPLLLLYILPHGVIEIPAVLYSVYLGGEIISRRREKGLMASAANALKKWLRIVLPMLLIAAFVEVYVTPLLIPRS